jgi:monoamine oxidase
LQAAAALPFLLGDAETRRRKKPRPKPPPRPEHADGPAIAIVGAGLAGLTAAYTLAKVGLPSTVYTADPRLGGRVSSASGLIAPGLITELGGEFIDSDHADTIRLARELGLELLDTAPAERGLDEGYYFSGRHYTDAEMVAAFRPIARRIAADQMQLPDSVSYKTTDPFTRKLDYTSLDAYLDQIGSDGVNQALLQVAFVTEYGADANRQSALNLLLLIQPMSQREVDLLGSSDERYTIRGGNAQIVERLAAHLPGRIQVGRQLMAIRTQGRGYQLTFHTSNGPGLEVVADLVLLTLPFSALRLVSLPPDLPDIKRRAIRELGYGSNAKLMFGVHDRVWRAQGYSGDTYTDQPFQSCWDNTLGQPGAAGGLTLFLGGRAGFGVGQGTPAQRVHNFLPQVDRMFPGVAAQLNGRFGRGDWPDDPFARGSYACYAPGQYTSIAGAEVLPVGNLLFAGEHCSIEDQGYMNGAVKTGRLAAEEIVRRIRG